MNPQTKQLLKLAKDISNVLFSLEMINQQAPVIVDFRKALTTFEQSTKQPKAIAGEKTIHQILQEFGLSDIPFDENVTIFYPALIDAVETYASQQTASKDKQLQVQQSHIDDQDQLIFEQDKEIKQINEKIK